MFHNLFRFNAAIFKPESNDLARMRVKRMQITFVHLHQTDNRRYNLFFMILKNKFLSVIFLIFMLSDRLQADLNQ